MATHRPLSRFGEVTVRFIQRPPDEQIVYFVQRCAKERWLSGPIAVTVESRPGGDRTVFEIRLAGPGEASGEAPVVEQGPDAFLAVRSAFDRYELSSLDRSPSNVANTRGGNLRR